MPEALCRILGVLDHFLQLLVVLIHREAAHEISSREKPSGLPLEDNEGGAQDEEDASCIQRNSADLSDSTARPVLIQVAKAVELTTYEHCGSHCCRETRHEDALHEKKWQPPGQVLERVAVDPLIDVLHVPVFIGQLAGEHTGTDIRVASFRYRRVMLNEHLMNIFEIVSHEFVAIRLESLAHPLILEAEVLQSEQTAC